MALFLAGGFLGGRLPSGALPASGLASRFALCLWAGAVAFLALAGLDFGLGMLPPIRGQGSATVIGFNKRCSQLVAAHVSLVSAGVDQFTFGHDFSDLWLTAIRPTRCLAGLFQCCNLLGLLRQPGLALLDELAGLLRLVWASVPGFIHFEKPIVHKPAGGWPIHRSMQIFISFRRAPEAKRLRVPDLLDSVRKARQAGISFCRPSECGLNRRDDIGHGEAPR